MGNKPDVSSMTRLWWQLVEILAGVLDEAEREAVLGDFSESEETGGRALREILGLVVRREAALWVNSRPWVILATLIIPLSVSISVLSRMVSGETAVYAWMYLNNWDWGLGALA